MKLKFEAVEEKDSNDKKSATLYVKLNGTSIDDNQLDQLKKGEFKYVTLMVPGKAQGKQVSISEREFDNLNSDNLRLKLKFEAVEEKDSNDKKSTTFYVRFPSNCSSMFFGSSAITNIDLKGVDSKYVTEVYDMFGHCTHLGGIEFGNFDISKTTDMYAMFYECESLITLDLTGFCPKNVKNMTEMFSGCKNLKVLKFGDNFTTRSVENMNGMFRHCESLVTLDFPKAFDTSRVRHMSDMFHGCKSLIDTQFISKFNMKNVEDMGRMFAHCTSLANVDDKTLKNMRLVPEGAWREDLFYDCPNLIVNPIEY